VHETSKKYTLLGWKAKKKKGKPRMIDYIGQGRSLAEDVDLEGSREKQF